jgi:hypothetical protein
VGRPPSPPRTASPLQFPAASAGEEGARGAVVVSIWRSRRSASTNPLSGGRLNRAGGAGDRRQDGGVRCRWEQLRACALDP